MKTGIELISEERQEQKEKHGYSLHDDKTYNAHGELIQAAKFCLSRKRIDYPSGWNEDFLLNILTPNNKTDVQILAIAGALIAAEIDRLNAVSK